MSSQANNTDEMALVGNGSGVLFTRIKDGECFKYFWDVGRPQVVNRIKNDNLPAIKRKALALSQDVKCEVGSLFGKASIFRCNKSLKVENMLCGAHQTGSVGVNKRHHTTAVMENMLLSSGNCDKLVKVQGTTIECELYMGSRDHVMFVDAGLLTKALNWKLVKFNWILVMLPQCCLLPSATDALATSYSSIGFTSMSRKGLALAIWAEFGVGIQHLACFASKYCGK
jgi:hypothetical protein